MDMKKSNNTYKANVYKSSYNRGFDQRKKEVFEDGYKDAYKLNAYSVEINNLDERLKVEYKKGFGNNSEVEIIRNKANEAGQSILPTDIPEEYEGNELMLQAYEMAFHEGRNELYKVIVITTTGVGAILMSILWVFKRKRKVT